jgi:hypothetical protein
LCAKETPTSIITVDNNWYPLIFSPSSVPQKRATMGRVYVTDDTNTVDAILTNRLNITLAIAVPKNASVAT